MHLTSLPRHCSSTRLFPWENILPAVLYNNHVDGAVHTTVCYRLCLIRYSHDLCRLASHRLAEATHDIFLTIVPLLDFQTEGQPAFMVVRHPPLVVTTTTSIAPTIHMHTLAPVGTLLVAQRPLEVGLPEVMALEAEAIADEGMQGQGSTVISEMHKDQGGSRIIVSGAGEIATQAENEGLRL